MDNKTKAILTIIIGSLIGGAVSPVTKIGLVKIPPFNFSFIRFLIASILLLPFFWKVRPRFNHDYKKLILLSLLPTLNIGLFVLGVKSTTASIGQMLYAGTPILAGIFSYYILGLRYSFKRWLFVFLGLIGVLLVIIIPLIEKNSLYSGDLKGNLLITVGMIVYSLYVVYSKAFQKKFSPLIITSTFFFLSTIIFFFLSLFELSNHNFWWKNISSSSIYSILYVALFATAGSYLLGQYAIKFSSPLISSFSLYLTPIFAYFWSYLLLGEQLTSSLIIGTVLVFSSIALTTYFR